MAYPGTSRASSPWRSPAAATQGRQCGPLGPHPWINTSDVRSIRRLRSPLPPQPNHKKAGLAFPILMPLKSLGCGWGEPERLTLKGASAAWGGAGSAGARAGHGPGSGQVCTASGTRRLKWGYASCPPREHGYQGERQSSGDGAGWGQGLRVEAGSGGHIWGRSGWLPHLGPPEGTGASGPNSVSQTKSSGTSPVSTLWGDQDIGGEPHPK